MSYLMRLDPFHGLSRMQREMERMMRGFFGPETGVAETEGIRIPSVDVSENDQEVIVKAEVPGIEKDNLDLEVLPEMLSLRAEVKQETEQKEQTFHRRERMWTRFERDIPLPAEVKPEEVKAKLENGLLEIHLPKTERARQAMPKRIEIA